MTNEPAVTVKVGTWVKLTGFEPDEEEVFQIVPEGRADPTKNQIPPGSPLARAIHGTKAGDKVRLELPVGETELTILEVGEL
jgi:transcription elongation GreA/GreB family factor